MIVIFCRIDFWIGPNYSRNEHITIWKPESRVTSKISNRDFKSPNFKKLKNVSPDFYENFGAYTNFYAFSNYKKVDLPGSDREWPLKYRLRSHFYYLEKVF